MEIDDIQQDLANLKAQLELNLATNAGVIETYERRQREVRCIAFSVLRLQAD